MSLDLDDVEEEEGGRAEEDGAEDDEPFVQHDRLIDPSAFAFDLCICCFRYVVSKLGLKAFWFFIGCCHTLYISGSQTFPSRDPFYSSRVACDPHLCLHIGKDL